MKLRYEPSYKLTKIKQFESNTKEHSPDQINHLAESITRFGFNDPIGITEEGVIVEGHGRFMAAHKLGLKSVPVVVLEGMSERDADLYRIAHNKIALSTGFNFQALVRTVKQIMQSEDDITLGAIGYDEESARNLLATFDDGASDMEDDSATVEEEANAYRRPKSKLTSELIFESKEQRREFSRFQKQMEKDNPDMTFMEAFMNLVEESGIIGEAEDDGFKY